MHPKIKCLQMERLGRLVLNLKRGLNMADL